MRRALLALAVSTLFAGPAMADDKALNQLVADYESYALGQDPILAGREGDAKALARLPDVAPGQAVLRRSNYEEMQGRLKAIDPAGLAPEAKLNRDFLAWTLDRRLKSLSFDEDRLPFTSDEGFDQTLGYIASVTNLNSEADAKAWISRLKAIPRYYADNIANARRGIHDKFVRPRLTAEIVLKRAKAAAAGPIETDPLLKPFDTLPASMPAAQKQALRAEALTILRDQIRPAQREFATFMEKEYLPAAQPNLGIRSVPGGDVYYRWLVADHTTTALSPDEIHALGEKEVARIRAEMQAVMTEAGWKGDLAGFIAMLRKDPRFYAESKEDLLEKAALISKRVDDRLPRWFATQPRLTFGVRPVPADIEEGYTSGRYFEGAPKQGIAGGFMVNTSHLDQRPLYELPALAFHESQPGHHLQIALAQELEGVPAFRRNADVTAFVEGWALYAEKLGGEMGLYRDPYERFGQLSMEMWRACRLVADTGIHWKGWTKEQARACFTDNTALAPINIENELNRYISWPGQALAYKVGELSILRMRAKAEAALGADFDIRKFHDAVLLAGPLPMDLLENRVDTWISTQREARSKH